jgi:hypothetical protein
MHKTSYPIELSTDPAAAIVYLDQRLPFQEHSQRIQIHADQIDTLIEWLRDAKDLLSVRGEQDSLFLPQVVGEGHGLLVASRVLPVRVGGEAVRRHQGGDALFVHAAVRAAFHRSGRAVRVECLGLAQRCGAGPSSEKERPPSSRRRGAGGSRRTWGRRPRAFSLPRRLLCRKAGSAGCATHNPHGPPGRSWG